ncbi:MAG: D-2-hydroxyacid dehydrogenase [Clostridia bacterium]|nr:D-2-hydroxyacid dehydrogenase [Clostridia bacterium]
MKITVVMHFDAPSREKLEKALPGCEIVYAFDRSLSYLDHETFDREKYGDDLRDADAVVGNPPPDLLPEMRKLGLLQLFSAGTEPYSLPGVLPAGAVLANTSGAFGKAISEHMLAALLTLTKKLHLYRDDMKGGLWRDRGSVSSLTDMTVLSVGMGDIGSSFLRLAKLLGARTLGVRKRSLSSPGWVDEVRLSEDLDELLPLADVVALSVPGNAETRGMFDEERLRRMKKGAILLNVGRGSAVDSDALCRLLDEGFLSGAALDVTDPEPLPPEHPLWRCENALITPHVSGFYHLRETYDNIVNIAVENLVRFRAGKPLLTPVDRETGYRVTQEFPAGK